MSNILSWLAQVNWEHTVLRTIVACSVLHNFLPPWEAFNDFPVLQKWYKLLIYLIGYVALNARSAIYPSLSTANGSKTSVVANGNVLNGNPAVGGPK